MEDTTGRKRKKPSEPRAGRKSPSTAYFSWLHHQVSPSTNSAEAEILRDQKISPLLAGIQSISPVERARHLAAAYSIVEDPACRKLLLKEHIVHLIMDRSLLDIAQEVVTAAWAFLNKLSLYEGYDVLVHLYRKGIMNLADRAIENITTSIVNLKADPKSIPPASQALIWDLTFSVVSFLTNLSETTKEILDAISKDKYLNFASNLLDSGTGIPEKVQTATTVFLDRLSDENNAAYALISKNSNCIGQLLRLDILEAGGPLLRTAAACSTLHNLTIRSHANEEELADEYNISDAKLAEPLTKIVQAVLSKSVPSEDDQKALFISLETLSELAKETVETFGRHALSRPNGVNGNADEMDEDVSDDDDMEEDISEPEDEDEEDSDEELPNELGRDLAMVTGEEGTTARASRKKPLNSPTLDFLVNTTIPVSLPLTNSAPSTEPERQIKLTGISLLSSIARAITALTSKTRKGKFTLPESLLDAYLPITHSIWNTVITPVLLSNSADISLAEKITELSIHITAFTPSVDISRNQHKSFLALYNAADSIPLKASCIKVLSNIAQCQGEERININKEIGAFLISTINQLPFLGDPIPEGLAAPEVIVECLNGIYDVYADAEFDYDEEVFVKLGFLKYLRSFVGRVKGMAKRIDKRKQFELRESADEALLNLNAFIKYKTDERAD
ncbi:hypothetical protein ABW19_dt0210193 [Dactylella cylindrospora]|nr:hypothetical protein ABW19_dt0210193 [Dactylella cylindrospora]